VGVHLQNHPTVLSGNSVPPLVSANLVKCTLLLQQAASPLSTVSIQSEGEKRKVGAENTVDAYSMQVRSSDIHSPKD